MAQLESTITNLTPATSANLTGAAVVPLDDSTATTVKGTLAQLRTKMFAGSTGYTAADPLVVGAINASGDTGIGAAALATSATTPFIWVPSTAGTPTGVPSASMGGAVPLVVDTTNSKLFARIAGAWTGTTLGSAGGTNQQLFTSSGTWTKPAGLTMATIECWGGAGGGAGGTSNASTGTISDRGGGGGGGGGYGFVTVPLSALAATVSVTIGAAGTGGAGGAPVNNNGVAGGNGGTTTFGTYISGLLGNGASAPAYGGAGSSGGAAKGPAPSGTADTIYLSGAGGAGSGAVGLSVYWGGAGGCGAGVDATIYTAATSVSLGVSGGVNGRGYSTGAGAGGNGTVGGTASGGGGGGSAAGSGNAGGNGAAGGAGYCRVTCY